jgi:tetratricopeptide (TPR) repeat protein
VAHLLEGSVQRNGNRVRVNAQLIDARTDAHLWAQTYDRDLADVFAIQSEIAKTIAAQLQARLSPTEKAAIEQRPTADLVAFDLYTRAKTVRHGSISSVVSKNNLLEVIDLLDQAVARDPAFFHAWCELAAAHEHLYRGDDHTTARLALADTALQTALRLQPDSGEAQLFLAQHYYRRYGDYDRARTELAIAQRTLPNDPRTFELAGYIDRSQGRWEESNRNLKRALELDPRNVDTLTQISLSYLSLRRYAETAAVQDRILAIVPKDVDSRICRALLELDWRADPRPVHATLEAILAEDPAATSPLAAPRLNVALAERDLAAADRALADFGDNTFGKNAIQFSRTFGEGLVARVRGDPAAANAAFALARIQQEEVIRAGPNSAGALCVLGLIDAALGRKEEALREGRRAVELLPVARDPINGPVLIQTFAIICAWAGETGLALEQLAIASQIPNGGHYGELKLDPFFDPLRGDPRFDKIVASLAPKEL